MMNIRELNARLHGLVIFRSLLSDPVTAKFLRLTDHLETSTSLKVVMVRSVSVRPL